MAAAGWTGSWSDAAAPDGFPFALCASGDVAGVLGAAVTFLAGGAEGLAAEAELPTAELPAAELPAAELPAAELPAAELPAAVLPVAPLPGAELSGRDIMPATACSVAMVVRWISSPWMVVRSRP